MTPIGSTATVSCSSSDTSLDHPVHHLPSAHDDTTDEFLAMDERRPTSSPTYSGSCYQLFDNEEARTSCMQSHICKQLNSQEPAPHSNSIYLRSTNPTRLVDLTDVETQIENRKSSPLKKLPEHWKNAIVSAASCESKYATDVDSSTFNKSLYSKDSFVDFQSKVEMPSSFYTQAIHDSNLDEDVEIGNSAVPSEDEEHQQQPLKRQRRRWARPFRWLASPLRKMQRSQSDPYNVLGANSNSTEKAALLSRSSSELSCVANKKLQQCEQTNDNSIHSNNAARCNCQTMSHHIPIIGKSTCEQCNCILQYHDGDASATSRHENTDISKPFTNPANDNTSRPTSSSSSRSDYSTGSSGFSSMSELEDECDNSVSHDVVPPIASHGENAHQQLRFHVKAAWKKVRRAITKARHSRHYSDTLNTKGMICIHHKWGGGFKAIE